jgi:hypothetical protein
MPSKVEKLWGLHSHVAAYVIPTRKLCVHLLRHRLPQAELLERVDAIKADPKIRKTTSFYYLGRAYIEHHPAELKLNPLEANLHRRLVRLADDFLKQLRTIATATKDIDSGKVTVLAEQFRPGFQQCLLQVLKAEVDEACKIIQNERFGSAETSAQPIKSEKQTRAAASDGPLQILTPPQLAKEWDISDEKVRKYIEDGILKATNISRGKTRKLYQITRQDAEECRKNMAAVPKPKEPPRKRRRQTSPGVTEYFK